MTEKNANTQPQAAAEGIFTTTLNDTRIDIAPDGNVVVFTDKKVQTKTVAANRNSGKEIMSAGISGNFDTVAMHGAAAAVATDGTLVVFTHGSVKVKPAALNDILAIGAAGADGWLYAGPSPETGRPMFVAPEDAGVMTWRKANKAAKSLQKNGVTGARLPSSGEMKQIFNNRATLGMFKQAKPSNMYWISGPAHSYFGYLPLRPYHDDSKKPDAGTAEKCSVRLVRS